MGSIMKWVDWVDRATQRCWIVLPKCAYWTLTEATSLSLACRGSLRAQDHSQFNKNLRGRLSSTRIVLAERISRAKPLTRIWGAMESSPRGKWFILYHQSPLLSEEFIMKNNRGSRRLIWDPMLNISASPLKRFTTKWTRVKTRSGFRQIVFKLLEIYP